MEAVPARQLQHAFQVFNLASSELCTAYEQLRAQALALTRELERANGKLERELSEKQALSQRFVLLLEALPGGVVVVDASGVIAQANPAAFRLLGKPLIGRPWKALQEERLAGAGVSGEWLRREAVAPLRLSIARRLLEPGEVLLIQDITEAHAEREGAERRERLAAMGEMAARLAHRLRTPLATALLYAAQIGSSALSPTRRASFAGKTVDRLQHLERLIEDMLLFVRGAQGEREFLSPGELLRRVAETLGPQARALDIALEFDDASGDCRIAADAQALRGALLSLAENALQACRAGDRVTLEARVREDRLEYRVRDTGRGIPPESQARLFEPFFTTRSGGTGLGLAIVRSVAAAHGGSVAAGSRPGEGSEFTLALPLART